MVLGELLATIGLGGGMVLLVSGIVAVYHLHNGIQLLGQLRTWVMAAAVFSVLLLAGEAGLIPGLDPQLTELISWFFGLCEWLVNMAANLVRGLL